MTTTEAAGHARIVESEHMASITEASSRGVSALAKAAEQGVPTVLMRNNRPVAAVLPMDAYYDWLSAAARTTA